MRIDTKNIDGAALLEKLNPDSGRLKIAWTSDDGRFLILEVRLQNYKQLIDSIGSMDYAESITSSGKIRLVKLRVSQLIECS